jgi:hypothetical protein
MSIVTVTAELTGVTPLIMHNPRLSDPLDDYTRRLKKISSKQKKTDDDHAAMSRIEWEGGLYYNETTGPYVPYEHVRKSLIEAARAVKDGVAVEEAYIAIPDRLEFDLAYIGPRTIEEMWEHKEFVDRRSAVVARQRVQRTRPRFYPWSLEAVFMFDTSRLNLEALGAAGERAGRFKGIGSARKINFGRYTFEIKTIEKL